VVDEGYKVYVLNNCNCYVRRLCISVTYGFVMTVLCCAILRLVISEIFTGECHDVHGCKVQTSDSCLRKSYF